MHTNELTAFEAFLVTARQAEAIQRATDVAAFRELMEGWNFDRADGAEEVPGRDGRGDLSALQTGHQQGAQILTMNRPVKSRARKEHRP